MCSSTHCVKNCTILILLYLFYINSFHNVATEDDAARVWTCIENAITLMTDEANAENECDSETNDST